jgi:hypothetical protein
MLQKALNRLVVVEGFFYQLQKSLFSQNLLSLRPLLP